MTTQLPPSLQYAKDAKDPKDQKDSRGRQASAEHAGSRPRTGAEADISRSNEASALLKVNDRPDSAREVGLKAEPHTALSGCSYPTGASLSTDHPIASLMRSNEPEVARLASRVSRVMRAIADNERMCGLAALIEDRHRDPSLRLDAACEAANMCEESLNRKLRALTGMTFHQLLARYRLLAALAVLIRTGQPTQDTALDTGFEWRQSLERCCARYLGETPAALRNRMLGKKP